MKGLWVAACVLGVIAVFFLLPVSVELFFREKLFVKVRLAGIEVFSLNPDRPKKEKLSNKAPKEKEKKTKKPAFFSNLKEQYGFSGTIKLFTETIKAVLVRFQKLLRHIMFYKLELCLTVAGEDASQTAIRYGEVCAVVYPLLGLLDTVSNVKIKRIDIAADFTSEKGNIKAAFSATVKSKLLFLSIFAVGALLEILKLKKWVEDEDERE